MRRTEFLIVGNGLAGTLLAFEMLKNDVDFLLMTSPEIKRASEIAAGMYNPLVFRRLTKSWMADDLLPVMKKTYVELEQLLGCRFFYEKNILKPLSEQEKQLWVERKPEPEFSKYIDEVLIESPVNYITPAAAYGKVVGSGYLNLNTFLQVADKFFAERNLLVRQNFNHSKADFAERYIKTGGIAASKVVFCEGAALRQNRLFNFVKLVPVKGELLQIHSSKLSEEYILNKKVFLLPLGNHRFKAGSTFEWKDLSDLPTEKGKRSIVERLEQLTSADYKIDGHWAGIRPATSDRRPVLGIHPEYSQLAVFNGLGTKGVMLAPYFAKEMLKLLTIKNYSVNPEADVKRFL